MMDNEQSADEKVTVYVTIRIPEVTLDYLPTLTREAQKLVAGLPNTTVEVRMVQSPPMPGRPV